MPIEKKIVTKRERRKGKAKIFKLREMKVDSHRKWKVGKYTGSNNSVLQTFLKDTKVFRSKDGNILRGGV